MNNHADRMVGHDEACGKLNLKRGNNQSRMYALLNLGGLGICPHCFDESKRLVFMSLRYKAQIIFSIALARYAHI
jgi:hypothetical protein